MSGVEPKGSTCPSSVSSLWISCGGSPMSRLSASSESPCDGDRRYFCCAPLFMAEESQLSELGSANRLKLQVTQWLHEKLQGSICAGDQLMKVRSEGCYLSYTLSGAPKTPCKLPLLDDTALFKGSATCCQLCCLSILHLFFPAQEADQPDRRHHVMPKPHWSASHCSCHYMPWSLEYGP